MKKPIADLTTEDLRLNPIWRIREDKRGNIVVSPVVRIPVTSLRGCLIGCQVILNNGQKQWADLSNIDLRNEKATSQFLVLSVTRRGKWFTLARYFDVDYAERGPLALSNFLDLPIHNVFPIRYDISPYVIRAGIPTTGLILEVPTVKLSQDDLIALSLE